MYPLKNYNISPFCIPCTLMPQMIPLLTLTVRSRRVHFPGVPLNASGARLTTPWIVIGVGYGDHEFELWCKGSGIGIRTLELMSG